MGGFDVVRSAVRPSARAPLPRWAEDPIGIALIYTRRSIFDRDEIVIDTITTGDG
jgi:hypothetical protein